MTLQYVNETLTKPKQAHVGYNAIYMNNVYEADWSTAPTKAVFSSMYTTHSMYERRHGKMVNRKPNQEECWAKVCDAWTEDAVEGYSYTWNIDKMAELIIEYFRS